MSGRGVDDFDTKLRFLAKQIVWIVVGLFIFLLTAWGIYIGYQYMDDECVRKTSYSLALDWWLITACVYDVVFWLVVMVLLCCRTRKWCRRVVIWPLNLANLVWMGVGIWLLVESQIRCQHNTLWVMSLVVICITLGIAASIIVVLGCTKLGACSRLGRWVSLEDTPYDYYMPVQRGPMHPADW